MNQGVRRTAPGRRRAERYGRRTFDASDPDDTYAFQWFRCQDAAGVTCTSLGASAQQQSYTIQSADAGSYMLLRVTASNAAGDSSGNGVYGWSNTIGQVTVP